MRTSPFFGFARPGVMGVLNVTPDSFSDGTTDVAEAVALGVRLAGEGAGIVDVGAEASSFFREGVGPVAPGEQIRRLVPVLEGLVPRLPAGVRVSVDTRSAEVAEVALGLGAVIVNDISAGEHDGRMLEVVAKAGAGIVLMHMSPGFPATPAEDDADIVGTVREYLQGRAAAAMAAGVPADHIGLDPGVGFGKTMADNWRLALRVQELRFGGQPFTLVLGVSRKRFLETAPPGHLKAVWGETLRRMPAGPHARDAATAAVTVLSEAHVHRVHDVTGVGAALRMG